MSTLLWSDEDEEKPWESDKFTQIDEFAYRAGVDTAPDKGPDHDKEFQETVERNLYKGSMEGRLDMVHALAGHMDKTEIKSGKFHQDSKARDTKEYREYKYHHGGSNTHGIFIADAEADERDSSDSDLDMFDDNDDDTQRTLENIRRTRLLELQQQSGVDMRKPVQGQSNLNTGIGVVEIRAEEFDDKVKSASHHGTVLMLIHDPSNRASNMMLSIVNILARKFPAKKWVVIKHTAALEHVPRDHCPILMSYHKGEVSTAFKRLDSFYGSKTTAAHVEWALSQCGILESDMTEDPRDSALYEEQGVDK